MNPNVSASGGLLRAVRLCITVITAFVLLSSVSTSAAIRHVTRGLHFHWFQPATRAATIPVGVTRLVCGDHDAETAVKWGHTATSGCKIRLWVFGGYMSHRQQPWLCLSATLSSPQVNPSGSPVTWSRLCTFVPWGIGFMLQTDHNSCRQSLSVYRVHSWGKARGGGGRKEEEGERRECGSQLPLLAQKRKMYIYKKINDHGKWDHNGARRNSRAWKHGAVILHPLGEDSDSVYVTKEKLDDTWRVGEKLWADEWEKLPLYGGW